MFEHRGQESPREPAVAMVRPMSRLGLYLAEMRAWPTEGGRVHQWLEANDAFRRQVLDVLRASGPLRSRDIPDTCAVPWASSGWTNDRNVTQMLEFLAWRGEVAVAGRQGRQRVWDVSERIYPGTLKAVPAAKARAMRDERRLRALGVARPEFVGDAGIPVEIEGTTGMWRVDPDASAVGFKGRTALLSPFDRLIHDRARALQLFDFDYTLEMYKPQSQRRWGYFALPVLHGDALVGKVDAIADRKTSTLRVNAIHEDVAFTPAMTKAVNAEIESLRRWLGLEQRCVTSRGARRLGGPVVITSPFGSVTTSVRFGASSITQPWSWIAVWCLTHTGRRLSRSVRPPRRHQRTWWILQWSNRVGQSGIAHLG